MQILLMNFWLPLSLLTMIRRLAVAAVLLTLLPAQASACRYTVRDIGFAALRNHEFAMVFSWQSPDDDRLDSHLASRAEDWIQTLKPLLAGSNITAMIDPARAKNSAATIVEKDAGANEDLAASIGSNYLGSNSVNNNPVNKDTVGKDLDDKIFSQIRVELVDRNGRSIDLTRSFHDGNADLADWFKTQVLSPRFLQISAESLETFAHLMVIEGDDAESNREAHTVVDQALAAVRKLEPLLPRPIAFPLRKMVISRSEAVQQPVLPWVLGRDAEDSAALLAVVYGRGRLAGPAMTGRSLAIQETLAQLALVGQSCECETDRAWLEEATLPFRWDPTTRNRASSLLGFDPDSPLVRAEMLRIVSQGKKSSRSTDNRSANGSTASDSPDAIARLLMGYTETELSDNSRAQQDASKPEAVETDGGTTSDGSIAQPPGVRATVITGDGWDFESPEVQSEATNARAATNSELPISNVDKEVQSKEEMQNGPIPQMLILSITTLIGITVLAVLAFVVWSK